MDAFSLIVIKLIPLYLIMLTGFLAGRFLSVSAETIANLLIYVISPVVYLGYVSTVPISISTLSLPVLVFVLCTVMEVVFYFFSRLFFRDATVNLVAVSAATANSGYFGIPLFLLLFGDQDLGVYMLAITGMLIFQLTLGYYVIARGNFTVADSLKKMLTLPPVYAVIIGVILSVTHTSLPPVVVDMIGNFRSAYMVLGVMMIGLSIAGIRHFSIDWRYISITFFAKFLVWPLLVAIVIGADRYMFRMFNPLIYNCLIILAVVPLLVDLVLFATQLRVEPEKAATGVFLSTLFALVYIPVACMLFIR